MFRTRNAALAAVLTAAVAVTGLVGCRPDPVADDPVTPPSTSPSPSSSTPSAPTPPSGKRSIVDAAVAGGLTKLTDDNAVSEVPVDPGEMRDGMTLVISHFSAPEGMSGPILFEGVDNVPEDTSKRREHLFRGMLDRIEWDPEQGQPLAEAVEAGSLGGSVECLLASLSEDGDVICGWADEGTAAVAHFKDTTVDEAAKVFILMRSDLEK